MNLRPKTLWRIGIAVVLAVLMLTLEHLGARGRIKTDLVSLLANGEDGESERAALREVMAEQNRVVALRFDGIGADEAAAAATAYLSKSGSVTRADVAGADSLTTAGTLIFDKRMRLLFPRLLAERKAQFHTDNGTGNFEDWLAEKSVSDIDDFLSKPESIALSSIVPTDPFLLMESCMSIMPQDSNGGSVVLATLSGDAMEKPAQEALLTSLAKVRAKLPKDVQMHETGAAIFANRSESLIRADVARLNIVMSVLLALVMFGVLRSLRPVLAVTLPVLVACTTAFVILFAFDWQVYALAIGIGGILVGIAVDYPLHVMMHKREGEVGHLAAARRMAWTLTLGCITTSVVFLALLFSHLTLMRQVGLIVASGIFACALAILPCFAALDPNIDTKAVNKRLERFALDNTRYGRPAFTLLLALLCLGIFMARYKDSVDVLQPPMPDLYREDALVRAGAFADSSRMVAAFGNTYCEAVESARSIPAGGLTSLLPTGDEVEAGARWTSEHGADFERSFRAALERHGYDSAAFAPLFAEQQNSGAWIEYEKDLEQLAGSLPAGVAWMMGRGEHGAWIVAEASKSLAILPPHTHRLDIHTQINDVFRFYRRDCMRLSLYGFVVASLFILIPCGIKIGVRILGVPILAVGAALGTLGLCGVGINLFHIVGLLLGYGLAMDYALFTHQMGAGRASVRLSAITTACSSVALVFSTIPAVRGLGICLLMVILFTLLQCELTPLSSNEPDR